MTEIAKDFVGKEIYRQLGGNKFRVMTGCTNFGYTENSLSFKIPRMGWMVITLNSMDTYDVQFKKIKKTKDKERSAAFGFTCWDEKMIVYSEHKGVYDDMLAPIFEQVTGLYTRL